MKFLCDLHTVWINLYSTYTSAILVLNESHNLLLKCESFKSSDSMLRVLTIRLVIYKSRIANLKRLSTINAHTKFLRICLSVRVLKCLNYGGIEQCVKNQSEALPNVSCQRRCVLFSLLLKQCIILLNLYDSPYLRPASSTQCFSSEFYWLYNFIIVRHVSLYLSYHTETPVVFCMNDGNACLVKRRPVCLHVTEAGKTGLTQNQSKTKEAQT